MEVARQKEQIRELIKRGIEKIKNNVEEYQFKVGDIVKINEDWSGTLRGLGVTRNLGIEATVIETCVKDDEGRDYAEDLRLRFTNGNKIYIHSEYVELSQGK